MNVAAAGSEGPTSALFEAFGVSDGDEVLEVRSGRVNATFIVGAPERLVIQRLNPRYFDDPLAVMENLVRVVGHLEWKQAFAESCESATRWFPALVPTEAGRSFAIDDEGCIWRAFQYLPGTTIDSHADDNTMGSIASVYGRFVAALDDFGGPALIETIPGFRSLDRIVADFDRAWDEATPERRSAVADEVDRARRLSDQVRDQTASVAHEGLRQRLLHNDTKLSNVLLDPATNDATAVIDFDLVMTGWAMDDFGDMVRSASHHRHVGDPDVEFVAMLATHYLQGAGSVLDPDEIESFSVGPSRVCVQLAWRYLTDEVAASPSLRVDHPAGSRGKAAANLDLADRLVGNATELGSVMSRLAAQEW